MAAFCLATAFQGLRVSSPRPVKVTRQAQSLASSKNGICSVQRVQLPVTKHQVLDCQALVVDAKLKTHKAAAKRYKVTGSGKVRARKPGKQHLNEKMSKLHKKRLSKMFTVNDSDVGHVKGQLPYSKVRKTGTK